jgi:hypothetical protein
MIVPYARERFTPAVFGPAAIAIAMAGAIGRYSLPDVALDTLFAVLLLAEFRLCDDLADRRADAVTHPDRVLVRAHALWPFAALCVALAIINVTWSIARDSTGISAWILITLHAVLGTWYSRRQARTLAGDQLLLSKYPAFVLIVAGGHIVDAPIRAGVLASIIYVAASAYEAWHDPVSPLGITLGGRS